MKGFTKENHFEFESLFQDEIRRFFVRIGPPSKTETSPFLQSIKDVRFFYETLQNKKIVLCLSGGIDSEAMCRAFIQSKIPFEVKFLKFKDDLNLFDISTNLDFCNSMNIKYSFVDLDIITFYESGLYYEVAQKYECQSPQIAAHLWFLDQIDGVPCLSGNPISPIWANNKWFFVGLPGELHSTYFKYFLFNNRAGIPWFFIYSPELIKSFLDLNCMKPYFEKKILQPSDYTYFEKCNSYSEGGFAVRPRENKFTGFELVKQIYDEKFKTKYGGFFNEQFRKPLELLFPYPDEYYQLIPKEFFDETRI